MLFDFRVRQRDYILQISRAITAQLDLAAVLRQILEAAVEMLSGQAGLIVLSEGAETADEETNFVVRASYGLPEAALELLSPLWVERPDRDDERGWWTSEFQNRLSLAARTSGLPLRQVVALPMSIGERQVGAIYVLRRWGSGLSANDRQVLASFADQAAIAVHNAQLYQQVSQEKRRLGAIIEHSADGVMILDAHHRIQVFNRALAALTGWRASDALGHHHDEVIRWARLRTGHDLSTAEAGGWPLPHQNEPGQGQTLYAEGDLERLDKSCVSVGITYAPLFDREGRLVNIIANVRDITRFREAEELKSTFISVISHELKTPVSLIKGYAGTLRRQDANWDQETLSESLKVIEEESDRLNTLIDNLLDASRLQAGALPFNLAPVDLKELAQDVAAKFQPQTDVHDIVVDMPDLPPVQGDKSRLEQVLDNLLTNAIKYSPEGGAIRISGHTRPNQVILSVSDEGIGIAPAEQTQIFGPFYRIDDALTRRTQGTGLGLYLVKAVIEAHDGQVWVESEPGQGATFSFSLPRD